LNDPLLADLVWVFIVGLCIGPSALGDFPGRIPRPSA